MNELNKLNFNEFIIKLKPNKPYVYFFKIEDNTVYTKSLRELFIKTKKKRKKRNYTAPNSIEDTETKCFYVESRKTSAKSRLKQHLGFLSALTGALHLSFWFPEKVNFSFNYIKIPCKTITYDI